jgi:hypothetical protein
LFESKSPLAMVITIDLSDQSINEDQTPIWIGFSFLNLQKINWKQN